MADTGVVLLNMGGPDSLEAVRPFLYNLFNDNDIIPLPARGLLVGQPLLAWRISSKRAPVVRDYYQLIGGRSPIADITRAQAAALERRLGMRCFVAMRYWHPFTDEALAEARKEGITKLVALTLYPHYTTATTGSSLRELSRRADGIELLAIDRYYDDPGYLDALAIQVRAGIAQFPSPPVILYSAHGLPRSFIRKGDPYVEHLLHTIAGVNARLAAETGRVPDWRLGYQSRIGEGWLGPGTEEVLKELAAAKLREVLAVPISFVSDHIETLYEIDLLFGEQAKALGLDMRRAPSLNDSPAFIEALAGLVRRRLGL